MENRIYSFPFISHWVKVLYFQLFWNCILCAIKEEGKKSKYKSIIIYFVSKERHRDKRRYWKYLTMSKGAMSFFLIFWIKVAELFCHFSNSHFWTIEKMHRVLLSKLPFLQHIKILYFIFRKICNALAFWPKQSNIIH